jgi:hypothetical protein
LEGRTVRLPSFRLVHSDEIERGGGRVHFTTAGRLELGRRYAAAMIELLPASTAHPGLSS